MFLLDKISHRSPLSHIHPAEKTLFAFLTMLICLISNSQAISLLVLFIMTGVSLYKGLVPLVFFLQLLALPIAFLMLGTLTIAINQLVSPTDFIWAWHWSSYQFGVTDQSLNLALHIFLRSLGSVSCLLFLALTTPFNQFIVFLKRLRIPTLLLELMVFTYHFLSILWDTSSQIYTAQASRQGFINLTRSYHSLTMLVANIFGQAYRRVLNLSTSMEARSYNGELHFHDRSLPICKKSLCIILLFESALLLIAWLAGNHIEW